MVNAIKKLAIGGAMALAVSGMVAGMSMTADAASLVSPPTSVSPCTHADDYYYTVLVDRIVDEYVYQFYYSRIDGSYAGYSYDYSYFFADDIVPGNLYHYEESIGFVVCDTYPAPTFPESMPACTHVENSGNSVYICMIDIEEGFAYGRVYYGNTGEYKGYGAASLSKFAESPTVGGYYHFDWDTEKYSLCPMPTTANAPSLHTMNIGGVTYNTWEEVSGILPTLEPVLEPVSGRFDDILHVDASGSNRIIPKHVITALTNSKVNGLHVFIGDGDAVTFFRNKDFSAYADTCFDHVDTITDDSKTVDFTEKKAIGAIVNFHTITKADAKVTVFKKNADGTETQICVLKADSEGRVCVAINELGTLIFRY